MLNVGLTWEAVVLQFCGPEKCLASGVPMACVLFPPAQVGVVVLPFMLFHQLQLIACAAVARHHVAPAPEVRVGAGAAAS